jgi:hypothetical protein
MTVGAHLPPGDDEPRHEADQDNPEHHAREQEEHDEDVRIHDLTNIHCRAKAGNVPVLRGWLLVG